MIYTRMTKVRQLIFVVGAFLLVGIAYPHTVEARGNVLEPEVEIVQTPEEETDKKLEEVKEVVEEKEKDVNKKEEIVETVKTEAQSAEQKKASLATEVASMKSEVEQLKAKVEAKRLAAAQPQARTGGVGGGDTAGPTLSAGVAQRAVVPGNLYEAGQCTWYVKNKRPDLPNNLGNADTWYIKAQAQGLPTGLEPRVGAAAPRKVGMHVVYVEAVNGDGTITISEMNYNFVPYATRTTIKNASDYYYIY